MLLVYFVVAGLLGVSCSVNPLLSRRLTPEDYFNEDKVVSCVTRILNSHYDSYGHLTFVDLGYGDDQLLRAVHSLTLLSVINRKLGFDNYFYNQGYLVAVSNVSDFVQNFGLVTHEPTWNPVVKFIIVVKRIKEGELRKIFDVLLLSHVLNVLVVNGIDLSLHTYNPYENYGCGKYYNRTINFGSCFKSSVDLYPTKLITRLRRCTMSVVVSHVPPYAIDPSKVGCGMLSKGIEQYALEIAAKKQQFNLSFIYKDFGEQYSTYTENYTFEGPLSMLQKGQTDMMFGAAVLSPTRAAAFDYTAAHLNLVEEVKCIVKRAPYIPPWKYFYIEFEPPVWLLLLFFIIVTAVLIIVFLKIRDWVYIFLILLDTLVLHGFRSCSRQSGRVVKCIIFSWLWFAYLVNCFYVSNMSSITIKPGYEPQISDFNEIKYYNITPCVSLMVSNFLRIERYTIINSTSKNCHAFFDSIRTVSQSANKFSVVLYSIYEYNKYDFYDEYGNDLLYVFDFIMFKVSYAIFMFKGFPLRQKLFETMLHLREHGLLQQYSEFQNFVMKYTRLKRFKYKPFEAKFILPWYLMGLGIMVSCIAFLAEVFGRSKVNKDK